MISGAKVTCLAADQTLARLEIEPGFDAPLPTGAVVTGTLRGPYSPHSQTLPAEFSLASGAAGKLTAQIVDPCYDTDALPMEYVLSLTAKLQGEVIADYESRIQLRANKTG